MLKSRNRLPSPPPPPEAYIHVLNGLGDRMLDIIGCFILCKYLNYSPTVNLNSNISHWGSYDLRLFHLNGIRITDTDNTPFSVNSVNPSTSTSPYMMFEFIQKYIPSVTFDEISAEYSKNAKFIFQPSKIIKSRIPEGIQRAYGIHLRRSDKVAEGHDVRHINTVNDFDVITNKILDDVSAIIMTEEAPSFLIVSEDEGWKTEFTQKVRTIAGNRPIRFITPNYSNPDGYQNLVSILDLFCLSQCKTIFQGVKYSTFSILASLLGAGKLKNYALCLPRGKECFIHCWNSAIEVNGTKNMDVEEHRQNARDFGICKIDTNIHGKHQ
jgi:hypothetical protein